LVSELHDTPSELLCVGGETDTGTPPPRQKKACVRILRFMKDISFPAAVGAGVHDRGPGAR